MSSALERVAGRARHSVPAQVDHRAAGDCLEVGGRTDARGKRERPNARAPDETAGGGQVFIRIEEGAVIDGVYRHGAVVAPAILELAVVLRTGTGLQDLFGFESSQGVAGQTAAVPDGRIDGGARRAVPDRDVPHRVHSDAAHPAPERAVGRKRTGLVNRWCRRRTADLVPANAGARSRGDRMVDHQRLVVAKVAIGQPVHQPVRQRVQ